MENSPSIIISVFRISRLFFFLATCFLSHFYAQTVQLCVLILLVMYASIFEKPYLKWTAMTAFCIISGYGFFMICSLIARRQTIRRWRLLRAVCDDVLVFKAEAQKGNISRHLWDSDLLRLQPVEEYLVNEAKRLLQRQERFKLSGSAIQNLLLLSWSLPGTAGSLIHDMRRHLESLDKPSINIYGLIDKFMSLLRTPQHKAVEDDSGSTAVRPVAELASSVLNKVNHLIQSHQDYPNLTRWMLIPVHRVRWTMMSLEAFLKDLEFVKLEYAIQKAWIEAAQALIGDMDSAIDSFTLKIGKNGFKPDWLLAWPYLLHEIRSFLDGIDDICKQKQRIKFNFTGRQQQPHPCLGDIAAIEEVQSLEDNIRRELNQESVKLSKGLVRRIKHLRLARQIKDLNNSMEEIHELLENVKAIKGAFNFKSFCVEQMRHIAQRTQSTIENCRRSSNSNWTGGLSKEINLIKPFIQGLDASVAAYDIELRRNSVMGLEEDTDALVSRLTTGSDHCTIFSIVGMQGIGKTTLANKVYNHSTILSHFPRRAWVCVPQGSTNISALLELVGKRITGIYDDPPRREDTKQYWLRKIQNFLLQDRYFVVLDNISTIKVWDKLKDAFPRETNGRLLLTTRCKTVSLHADQNNRPYLLRLRTNEESWALFNEKAQFHPDHQSQEMQTKVKELVLKCRGLPLTISCLGFLMSRRTPDDQELTKELKQIDHHGTLWSENLSNNASPEHLKAIAYLTIFPKNYEIPVRRLLALWVADGVGQQIENGKITPENMAENYLSELIDLNMVQPVKNDANGKVKICCLPDSLWDVVWSKSRRSNRLRADHVDKNYAKFTLIHGAGTFPLIERQRYKNVISLISSDTRDGDEPGEDIGNFLSRRIANGCFKKLRVLDLEHVFQPQLPNTIGNFVELTYLGLRRTYLKEIPSSICNLMNLQTLDLKHTKNPTLPLTIWKLQNLWTLWGVFLDTNSPLKDTIHKLKSLRKLKLTLQLKGEDQKKLARRVAQLQHLQSLKLSSIDDMDGSGTEELYSGDYTGLKDLSHMYLFGRLENVSVLAKLPHALSILTLAASRLQDDPMPILERLPNLRSLTLFSDSYSGERMVCSTNMFRNLLVLKLQELSGLREWTIEEKAMENLKELKIKSCELLEFPTGLWHLKTLRKLKVSHMPEQFKATLDEDRGYISNTTIPDIISE